MAFFDCCKLRGLDSLLLPASFLPPSCCFLLLPASPQTACNTPHRGRPDLPQLPLSCLPSFHCLPSSSKVLSPACGRQSLADPRSSTPLPLLPLSPLSPLIHSIPGAQVNHPASQPLGPSAHCSLLGPPLADPSPVHSPLPPHSRRTHICSCIPLQRPDWPRPGTWARFPQNTLLWSVVAPWSRRRALNPTLTASDGTLLSWLRTPTLRASERAVDCFHCDRLSGPPAAVDLGCDPNTCPSTLVTTSKKEDANPVGHFYSLPSPISLSLLLPSFPRYDAQSVIPRVGTDHTTTSRFLFYLAALS